MNELKSYAVWDAPTRLFHWINALSIFGLIAVGVVILNADALGITKDGKIALKTLHVWIGYVLALNFFGRIVWAFLGNRHARWRQMLPGGRGYSGRLARYIQTFVAGSPEPYLGHNPLGRIAVVVLLTLIAMQTVTGLILAGTDIFYPPLGHWISRRIAAPGTDPASLVPYALEMVDPAAYQAMRSMREPIATAHLLGFYALAVTCTIHIAAVVVTELRGGGTLVSAMLTGRKVLPNKPLDD